MKAKSRKRLLISSVAMLLVAMLALGTATFAWFTTSPTATADGIKLKATASNGLKILTESHITAKNISDLDSATWLSSDFLRYKEANGTAGTDDNAFVLDPASFAIPAAGANMVTGYKVQAADYNAATADPDGTISAVTPGYNTGEVFAEKIYCKLVGATASTDTSSMKLKKLNLTVADNDLAKALRIVIAYNGKLVKAYANAASGETSVSNAAIPNGTAASTVYKTVTMGTATFEDWDNITGANPTAVTIGNVQTTGADYVTVYAYLDGEDTNCKSANINMNDLITNLDVVLTIE